VSAIAVIELFTSEGCSSCPPADDVLAELAARRERGDAVVTLGFHVDYWDHLGWAEPFGSPAWTQRQTDYARALGLRGLYTPQAVINGTVERIGSRGREVRRAVDTALRATWTSCGACGQGRPAHPYPLLRRGMGSLSWCSHRTP
jgi:hypothetical protein